MDKRTSTNGNKVLGYIAKRIAVRDANTCGDGSLDVKKIKSSARKRRISGLFRKLGIEA